jgi:hypothetical protein
MKRLIAKCDEGKVPTAIINWSWQCRRLRIIWGHHEFYLRWSKMYGLEYFLDVHQGIL